MKKFVISMTAGMAIATTALVPKTAQAHVGWKDTYYCNEYTITLNEYARQEYSYSARSRYGNIYLTSGSSQNSGNSWIYSFNNAKTNYELEDPWNSQTAYLRVYNNGRPILKRSCQK
ncbi:MAG: hypothetical protein KME28_01395 [Pelatocladus maniniholoensis HA4357-MV3]|jgi:hypothetical protein|uniref:Uncharacterized protein n=1 Tax=Pelatocladus maniniholoensis HA4357-MV3 TaxID=1117104 RepID=A0A9E3H5A3_9NOST|nr:hypothetical protein [Pelatocladus maniniholoensis HA4357-MV3]BAZ65449.1 hypothetical protein NIES4106_01880 [Fischerella sp. NIES-4106]